MAQRYQLPDGRIAEALPGGGYKIVSGGSAIGPAIGGNPSLPLDMQGKSLSNTRTQQEIRQAEATAGATTRKANAEATSAEVKARTDTENYAAAHLGDTFAGATGPELLGKLPAEERAIVQAMLDGRQAPPTGTAAKDPQWQRRLIWAHQIDPTFDTNDYTARTRARAALANGALGKSQNALNTAIGHAAHLMENVDKVSSLGPFPLSDVVNSGINYYNKKSGDPGIREWNYIAGVLGPEIETVYRNGGGSEQGVERQIENLGDPNASAAAKRAAIHDALDLLASKMAANYQQYAWAFKGGKPTWDMLDPDAREQLKKYAPDILNKYFAAPNGGFSGGGNPPSGGLDTTNNGSVTPITPGSTTRTEPFSAGSAFIDSQIAQNVPYRKAIAAYRQQFPDAPIFQPGQYNQALAFHRKHPDVTSGYGAAEKAVPLSLGEQAANTFAQSGPGALAGHFVNAAAGGLPTLLAGDKGAYFNALSGQQHSALSTIGDIGGAVAGTIGTGLGLNAGARAAERSGIRFLSPAAEKYLASPAARSLAPDLTYGATFGATQNPDHPVAGAVGGAAAMGLGNVVGRYVLGPGIAAAGTTGPGGKIAGMFGGTPTPKLPSGDAMIARQATDKLVPDIMANLNDAADLNLPYSLADANPQLRMLAGSASRKSPVVRQLAEDTIGPRHLGQGERAIAAIDTHLAPSGDLGQINADALTRARTASQPLYEKAMAHPAPDDQALRDLLSTPAGESAAREAYTIALNKGEKPGDLSFHTLENGDVRIDGNPNWRTLQYMKQGIDAIAEKGRNPVTGKISASDPAAQAIQAFRSKFTGRLHALNPDYAAADDAFAKFAKQGSAADMGALATSPRVSPTTVGGTVGNMAPEHLPFYQQGYASSLASRVDNLGYTADPYKAIYGTPAQRAKVSAIFPQGAERFGRVNALEGDMAKTNYETLGGSPTQPRAEADKLFENGPANLAGDLAFTAASGTPTPGLFKHGMKALAGDAWRFGLGKSAQAKAEQIGPMLLNTDPAEAARLLMEINARAAARRGYVSQSRALGGMFGAPLAAPFIAN